MIFRYSLVEGITIEDYPTYFHERTVAYCISLRRFIDEAQENNMLHTNKKIINFFFFFLWKTNYCICFLFFSLFFEALELKWRRAKEKGGTSAFPQKVFYGSQSVAQPKESVVKKNFANVGKHKNLK